MLQSVIDYEVLAFLPYWLACLVSFIVVNLTFSALESEYRWKYMFMCVANLEKLDDPLNKQNNPDDHQKSIHP